MARLHAIFFVAFVASYLRLGSGLRMEVTGHRRSGFLKKIRSATLLARHTTPMQNIQDLYYYTNITLNGKPYDVQVDTGSADLYIAGNVPEALESGKHSGQGYADGHMVDGPVKFANMSLCGFNVTGQAYMEILPNDQDALDNGLLGLGPSFNSRVWSDLGKEDRGLPFLDRHFINGVPPTSHFITTLLGRSPDPVDGFLSDLTIGEVLPDYSSILDTPKIPMSQLPSWMLTAQHFQVLLDVEGLTGPDGQPIMTKSRVKETADRRRLTAMIDSGFSLSQVPASMAYAIYSRIPGAKFHRTKDDPKESFWIVPCTAEVNMTWWIGGMAYPVHPLDATLEEKAFGSTNSTLDAYEGGPYCVGLFQPISFDIGDIGVFDIVLGASFLRNVYALHHFGHFVANDNTLPYMQFLSVTDPVKAHKEFVATRLGGNDTTSDQKLMPWPKRKIAPGIVAGIVVGASVGVLLIVISAYLFCKRSGRRKEGTPSNSHQVLTSITRRNLGLAGILPRK